MALEAYAKEECQGYKTITTSIGGRNTNRGSITIALPETAKQIDSADVMKNKLRKHFIEFPSARLSSARASGASGLVVQLILFCFQMILMPL